MQTLAGPPQLLSEEKPWNIAEATASRHRREPYALIETLYTARKYFSSLAENALRFSATELFDPCQRPAGGEVELRSHERESWTHATYSSDRLWQSAARG